MSELLLKDRDYTIIVAKIAPTQTPAPPGYEQRWAAARSEIIALAEQCEALDPDGITIYIPCRNQGGFAQYRHVSSQQIQEIFNNHYPPNELSLLEGLQTALDDYFTRKAAGHTKANGEMILVLIDGEPKDRMAIVQTIVQATQRMEKDEELGIGFAQVGDDVIARGFLNSLDIDLHASAGAKFDIVNTRVLKEVDSNCLTDFLLDVIRN